MLNYLDKKNKITNKKSLKVVGGVTEVISESEKIVSKWVSEGLKPSDQNQSENNESPKSEPKFLEFI